MLRIQIDERKEGEWKRDDLIFAEACLVAGLTRDDETGHLQIRIAELDRHDGALILASGRETCWWVVRAFPLALWKLLTGWMRKKEEGWRDDNYE